MRVVPASPVSPTPRSLSPGWSGPGGPEGVVQVLFVPMRDLTTNKWGQWDLVWGHVKPSFCVVGMST